MQPRPGRLSLVHDASCFSRIGISDPARPAEAFSGAASPSLLILFPVFIPLGPEGSRLGGHGRDSPVGSRAVGRGWHGSHRGSLGRAGGPGGVWVCGHAERGQEMRGRAEQQGEPAPHPRGAGTEDGVGGGECHRPGEESSRPCTGAGGARRSGGWPARCEGSSRDGSRLVTVPGLAALVPEHQGLGPEWRLSPQRLLSPPTPELQNPHRTDMRPELGLPWTQRGPSPGPACGEASLLPVGAAEASRGWVLQATQGE